MKDQNKEKPNLLKTAERYSVMVKWTDRAKAQLHHIYEHIEVLAVIHK